jgi:hypothetical protein
MVAERPVPTMPTAQVVALHLTGSRRRILEVLRECGPRTDEGIADCWIRTDGGGDRWGGRLPGLVGRLTWKLEHLGWIDSDEDQRVLTTVGRDALAAKA